LYPIVTEARFLRPLAPPLARLANLALKFKGSVAVALLFVELVEAEFVGETTGDDGSGEGATGVEGCCGVEGVADGVIAGGVGSGISRRRELESGHKHSLTSALYIAGA
jgi:hypothetical protein